MEHSRLFQDAVELIMATNEKLTRKLENNSIFGNSSDAEEMTDFTRCFSFVYKSLIEADEYDAVVYNDDEVPTWRTGCTMNDYDHYVYLKYMPCEGRGNGIMRLEHYMFDGDKCVHALAYMICAGQNPYIEKYNGSKVSDDNATPDWSF